MGSGGTTLKTWREKHGWSQQKLATELGLALPTISQWERGVIAAPRREHIESADALLEAGGEVVAGFGYATADADVVPEIVTVIERLTDALALVHSERAEVLQGIVSDLRRIEKKIDAQARPGARSSR